MVDLARDQIEAAFAPRHPKHAHKELAVTESVEILARLKPRGFYSKMIEGVTCFSGLGLAIVQFGLQPVPAINNGFELHALDA